MPKDKRTRELSKARKRNNLRRNAALGFNAVAPKGVVNTDKDSNLQTFHDVKQPVRLTEKEWDNLDHDGVDEAQQAARFDATRYGQITRIIHQNGRVLAALKEELKHEGRMVSSMPFASLVTQKDDNNKKMLEVVLKAADDGVDPLTLDARCENGTDDEKQAANGIKEHLEKAQESRAEVYSKLQDRLHDELSALEGMALDPTRNPQMPISSTIALLSQAYEVARKRVNMQKDKELDAIDQLSDKITKAGGDPGVAIANMKKQITEQYNRDIEAIKKSCQDTRGRLLWVLGKENIAKWSIIASQSKDVIDQAIKAQGKPSDSKGPGKIMKSSVGIKGLDLSEMEYLGTPTGNLIHNTAEGASVRFEANASSADKQRDIEYLVRTCRAKGYKSIDLTVDPASDERLQELCYFAAVTGGYENNFTINGQKPTLSLQNRARWQVQKALDLSEDEGEIKYATTVGREEMKEIKNGPVQQPVPPSVSNPGPVG